MLKKNFRKVFKKLNKITFPLIFGSINAPKVNFLVTFSQKKKNKIEIKS